MSAVPKETVSLPQSADEYLRGDLALSGAAEAVLYVHGFGSDRRGEKAQALVAACVRHGLGYAAFDFRCHGESSGRMPQLRGSGILADLEAVRGYLGDRGVRRLFLVGSSMGGWASAWFAAQHPDAVAALVLLAPAFRFLHARWECLSEADRLHWQTEGTLHLRNQWLDVELGYGLVAERDRFDPNVLAGQWATPTLIYHGMRDETVAWQDSVRFVEATAYPRIELRLLRDGDHRLTAYRDEVAEEACRFFARCR